MSKPSPSVLRGYLPKVILFALICLPVARLGPLFAFENGNVSLVWPLTGVALAVMLLYGRNLWPGLWLAIFISNLINHTAPPVAFAIAVGSTATSYIGARVLQDGTDFRITLGRIADVLNFTLYAVLLTPMIGAAVGVAALYASGQIPHTNFLFDAFTWWVGDAMGVMVVAPALLMWSNPKLPTRSRRQWVEAVVVSGLLVLLCALVFSTGLMPRSFYPLAYLLFPPLIWCALRFGQRMVATLMLIISALAVIATAQQFNQFNQFSTPMIWNTLLFLWAYLAAMAITGLLLAATLAERRDAETVMRSLEKRFSTAFHTSPIGMIVTTLDGGIFVDANEEYCAVLGYTRDEVIGKSSAELRIWETGETRGDLLTSLREQGRIHQVAVRMRTKSGTLLQGLISVEPVELEGKPCLLGTFRDITAQLQTEAALRESEAHYRQLFEGVNDAIYVHDMDANILDVNEATARRMGYSRDELLKMKVTDLDMPGFARGFKERLNQQLEQGFLDRIEGVQITKSGREVQLDISTKLITYKGQPAILAVDRDITERKRTESMFRGLLEAAPDAMVIVNEAGKIVLINVQTQRLFGYNADELIGQSVDMLVPLNFRAKHPAHRADYYADTVTREMGHGMELYALRKDGTEFPVEISLSPMETEDGILVSSAIRDISERKTAEKNLRESEARYRAVVEDQSELICRFTPDFILTFANDAYCRYFGLSREQLIGTPFIPSIYEEDAQGVLNVLHALSAENPVITSENRAYMGDGTVRWHQWRDHAIIGENGKIIEYQSVGKDVTELKEMEKQRLAVAMEHEKVQILADFIAAASHDFRTPLSVINTSAYLLNRVIDPKQRSHHFKQIQEQTYHIEHLVDGLLTMSRLDRGDVFRFKALNMNSVVQQIEVRKRSQIDEKLQSLKLELDPNLPSIDADEGWVYQCLIQLVDNSIYYTPPGGTITIRTYSQADRVVVGIIDTGIGISDEILPHIFKRLYRGEEHRPVGGQGLGLSIVAKIIEEHQGSIDVESKLGAGSTFRVFLPLKHVDTTVQPVLSP